MDENEYKSFPTEEGQYRQWMWRWMQEIKNQTIKTNGRVTKVEQELARLTLNYKIWRAGITGGVVVITTVLIPLLFIILSQLLSKNV